ncbi:MAG: ADP-ribosylation factor protein 3 [Peltula sp. TS41687]|nr:MAG: ADP-ribosylation factor protein 3 [Peltula sp. TS41687]
MYHLVKSLYLHATSKEEYSILLLGLDNAGKTTLLNQIKALYLPQPATTNPSQTVPTVGQNVCTITLADMYLKIWDVGGQHSLRKLWESYYRAAHAIIFVVDSTDVGDGDISQLSTTTATNNNDNVGRLDECRKVLEDVLRHADTEGVPLLVLANKQDREDCIEVVRVKEGFVRKVFEKSGGIRDSRVLPVSAMNGSGVREAVEWVCSRVRWNRESRPGVMR